MGDDLVENASTLLNSTALPTSAATFSIWTTSPGATRYCLPPVRITAYIKPPYAEPHRRLKMLGRILDSWMCSNPTGTRVSRLVPNHLILRFPSILVNAARIEKGTPREPPSTVPVGDGSGHGQPLRNRPEAAARRPTPINWQREPCVAMPKRVQAARIRWQKRNSGRARTPPRCRLVG